VSTRQHLMLATLGPLLHGQGVVDTIRALEASGALVEEPRPSTFLITLRPESLAPNFVLSPVPTWDNGYQGEKPNPRKAVVPPQLLRRNKRT